MRPLADQFLKTMATGAMASYGPRLHELQTQFLTLRPRPWLPTQTLGPVTSLNARCQALKDRIDIDIAPEPVRAKSLISWCQHEGLSLTTVLQQLKRQNFNWVHQMHARALADWGVMHTSLANLEQLSWTQMRIPHLDAAAALTLIHDIWQAQNTAAATWLEHFLKRQRLVITQADTDTAWCRETPFGAYVYVDYAPDLPHLMTLVHELGHAHHQDQHRLLAQRPLRTIEKETAAIQCELAMLQALAQRASPWPAAVAAYQRDLHLEMCARQWMLSQFEYDLYRLSVWTPDQINALWCQHLQHFYGPQITLDEEDATAWMHLPQLLNAPFYRLSYPIAYQRAIRAFAAC